MVFFDDDPVNRELIKMGVPEIQVIDFTKRSIILFTNFEGFE